jgi:hypothetical protein
MARVGNVNVYLTKEDLDRLSTLRDEGRYQRGCLSGAVHDAIERAWAERNAEVRRNAVAGHAH